MVPPKSNRGKRRRKHTREAEKVKVEGRQGDTQHVHYFTASIHLRTARRFWILLLGASKADQETSHLLATVSRMEICGLHKFCNRVREAVAAATTGALQLHRRRLHCRCRSAAAAVRITYTHTRPLQKGPLLISWWSNEDLILYLTRKQDSKYDLDRTIQLSISERLSLQIEFSDSNSV